MNNFKHHRSNQNRTPNTHRVGKEGELARSMYQLRRKDSDFFGDNDEPISPVRGKAESEVLNKSY